MQTKKIAILGAGRFGTYLAREIEKVTGQKAPTIDKGEKIPKGTTHLILCVPMRSLKEALEFAIQKMPKNGYIMDTCSVKGFAVKAMDEIREKYKRTDLHMAGSHPLFGPQSAPTTCQGQTVAVCPLPGAKPPTEAIAFWKSLGTLVIPCSAEEHDKEMANQALNHFIGRAAHKAGASRTRLRTKTHDLFMDIVDITVGNSRELFQDIFAYNPHAAQARSRFLIAANQITADLLEFEPRLEHNPPRVVCAANRGKNGRIICGARHYDAIMHAQIQAAKEQKNFVGSEQGFIDQRGNFLTRKEALELATKQGQIHRRCGGDHKQLFSENLY